MSAMLCSLFIIALLSLTLLGSLALNLILYRRAHSFYARLNEALLDPLGSAYYPAEELSGPTPGVRRVVFFGDSRAEDWPLPEVAGYEFVNRGIGGQMTIQVLERFERHVAPLRPDVVLIQVGINDLATIPIFPDRQAEIVADCKANIEKLVDKSRALGAVVLLTTILPLGAIPLGRRVLWSDEVIVALKEVNDFIRTFTRPGVVAFDGESLIVDEQRIMRKPYTRDYAHPNEAGYRVVNEGLRSVLEGMGRMFP